MTFGSMILKKSMLHDVELVEKAKWTAFQDCRGNKVRLLFERKSKFQALVSLDVV